MKGDVVKRFNVHDTTTGDSDKDIDLLGAAGHFDYTLEYGIVKYTSDGTAGNRLLTISVEDSAGVEVFHCHPGSYQAANLTYHYYLLPGIYRETVSAVAETSVDGTIQVPIPERFLIPHEYTLRIYDKNAVAAAGDDMEFHGLFTASIA